MYLPGGILLQDSGKKLGLKNLFSFLTGARRISGSPRYETVNVKFIFKFILTKDGEKRCPIVATCAGELTMAMFSSYEKLKNIWVMVFLEEPFDLM